MLIPSRWCCHPICLKNHFEPPSKKNVIAYLFATEFISKSISSILKNTKIIHIDSLCWDQPKNPTSFQIAKMLFKNSKPTFEFLFSERKQFDANSCGVWLVTEMSLHLKNIPGISDIYNVFDIAYNLLERNPIIQKVESLSQLKIRWKKLPQRIS